MEKVYYQNSNENLDIFFTKNIIATLKHLKFEENKLFNLTIEKKTQKKNCDNTCEFR